MNSRQKVSPCFDLLPVDQQNDFQQEVESALELWDTHGNGKWKNMLLVKDSLAHEIYQNILLTPSVYDLIATMNLNGDCISDAAALVGCIGIEIFREKSVAPCVAKRIEAGAAFTINPLKLHYAIVQQLYPGNE